MRSKRYRLLVLDSHPVQYRTPLYRFLASCSWLDLEVWFGDTYGVIPRESRWGVDRFTWDGDQLAGYRSRFLRNISPKPDPSTFLGKITPGLSAGVRTHRPDAVMVFGYGTLFQWLSFRTAWRGTVPILFLADTNAAAEPVGTRGFLKRSLLPRLYRRIDAFFVIGTMNRKHYEEYRVPEERQFFSPFSVDNRYFAGEAKKALVAREEIRRGWGVRPGSTCSCSRANWSRPSVRRTCWKRRRCWRTSTRCSAAAGRWKHRSRHGLSPRPLDA